MQHMVLGVIPPLTIPSLISCRASAKFSCLMSEEVSSLFFKIPATVSAFMLWDCPSDVAATLEMIGT